MDATISRIGTAEELARRLAVAARGIREAVLAANDDEAGWQWLRDTRRTLTRLLFGEAERTLDSDDFADTLAQVIAFSLFVDCCERRIGGASLERGCASHELLNRNWLLRRLFVGVDRNSKSDESIFTLFDELDELLDAADINSIVERLRRRSPGSDGLTHFYELFLAHYDAALRRTRGVYYTPQPVVSYLVRSVDHVLRTHFQIPDGLAGESVQGSGFRVQEAPARVRIVDPACGAGIFLAEVIEHWQANPATKGVGVRRGMPSLTGFEILPASCIAARLLLGRLWDDDGNVDIRWANPLDGDQAELNPLLNPPYHDTDIFGETTSERQPILVVLGNPPYANFGQQNRSRWILDLLGDYKRGLGEKKLNLNDDFIKFLRWGQHWIDRAGAGIMALITNNTYLTGLTHRQMRRSLAHSFSDIYLLDLHGSGTKKEIAPSGEPDENVFDIQQGVAIGLFVKRPAAHDASTIHHAELWGSRKFKLRTLQQSNVGTTSWTVMRPEPKSFFFVPRGTPRCDQYLRYPRLDEIFRQYTSGVQTKKDSLLVAMTREELAEKMRAFLDPQQRVSSPPLADILGAKDGWLERKAQGKEFSAAHVRPYMVAPLDVRWVYYDPRLLGRARWPVMRHMLQENIGLAFMRQCTGQGEYDHFLVTDSLVSDRVFYSAHGAPFLAPLYLYPSEGEVLFDVLAADQAREANLDIGFVRDFAARLNLTWVANGAGDLHNTFGAEDLLHYMYAVFHSRTYRQRYAEQLRVDFPRLPLTSDPALFGRLCQLGKQLVDLHLRRSTRLNASFDLANVPQDAADFHVGGYPVLKKWLRARRGKRLTVRDAAHVQLIAEIATETTRLMSSIDTAISTWPIR
jgi:predicted helicase